jgi:hypothetical protein
MLRGVQCTCLFLFALEPLGQPLGPDSATSSKYVWYVCMCSMYVCMCVCMYVVCMYVCVYEYSECYYLSTTTYLTVWPALSLKKHLAFSKVARSSHPTPRLFLFMLSRFLGGTASGLGSLVGSVLVVLQRFRRSSSGAAAVQSGAFLLLLYIPSGDTAPVCR